MAEQIRERVAAAFDKSWTQIAGQMLDEEPEMEGGIKRIGFIGLFDDPAALLRAAERVRDAGRRKWDCHTPYPIHGLDDAMGLRPSPIPFVTITSGFIGLAGAVALTGGLSVFQYPLIVGGKPLFSWQAFVPIYFELFVLFAALATMGSIIFFCKLGRWHSPLHDSNVMAEVTSGRFAIAIHFEDGESDPDGVRALLEQGGCQDIRPMVVIDPEDDELI